MDIAMDPVCAEEMRALLDEYTADGGKNAQLIQFSSDLEQVREVCPVSKSFRICGRTNRRDRGLARPKPWRTQKFLAPVFGHTNLLLSE